MKHDIYTNPWIIEPVVVTYYFCIYFFVTLLVSILYEKALDIVDPANNDGSTLVKTNEGIVVILLRCLFDVASIGLLYVFIMYIVKNIPFVIDHSSKDYSAGSIVIPLILLHYHIRLQNRLDYIVALTK